MRVVSAGRRALHRVHWAACRYTPSTYMLLHYGWSVAIAATRSRAYLEGSDVQPMRALDWSRVRTSDTLFVFGSGTSVNRLGPAQWAEVREHDSFGFNFWVMHEHVPTVMFQEGWNLDVSEPSVVNEQQARCMRELYALRVDDLTDVPQIVRADAPRVVGGRRIRAADILAPFFPPQLLPNAYASTEVPLMLRTEESLPRGYRTLRRIGVFSSRPRRRVRHDPYQRASSVALTMLGVRLGYRRIVLCGVDLNDTQYFFEERRAEFEARGWPVPPNAQAGTVHRTNDPAVDLITVSEILAAFDDEVLRPLGAALYVGHASSALHPRFPVYPWRSSGELGETDQ